MLWIQFLISAAIIVLAGIRLTVYADLLSDRLNVGKVWVGAILLGLVTSLPEAVATLTAVIQLDAVDLAIGNLVGSNNFNPLLLVVMDLFYRKGSITNEIKPNHYHELSGLFSILMSVIIIMGLLWSYVTHQYTLGHTSWFSVALCFIYVFGMRKLSSEEGQAVVEVDDAMLGVKTDVPTRKIYIGLLICAVLVVFAAVWLANIADTLAEVTGLGGTFVGSIFLAIVTSLPEMVVSIQSVKMGCFDLAIGNIFGSNMTNTFIIFLCDLVSRKGPILLYASQTHILTAVMSIILSVIVLIGIRLKRKRTFFGIGWDSLLMAVIFLAGTRILYSLR